MKISKPIKGVLEQERWEWEREIKEIDIYLVGCAKVEIN